MYFIKNFLNKKKLTIFETSEAIILLNRGVN